MLPAGPAQSPPTKRRSPPTRRSPPEAREGVYPEWVNDAELERRRKDGDLLLRTGLVTDA
jgi:hypothetical protein